MIVFTVTVPGQPPSVNHMYGGPRRYKVAGVEEYQVAAAALVRLARPKDWKPTRRTMITYRMWLTSTRMDASNHLKALEDAIAAALGINDSTFLISVPLKETDKMNPRVEVTIENVS